MLRETTFVVGGCLTLALGAALAGGLAWAGAGFGFFGAYLGAGLAAGFGLFFLYVGRSQRRQRREDLDQLVAGSRKGPGE